VEELPDGTVVLSSRKGGGRYFNLFTFNDDDTYTSG
jgi:sialidase-1